MEILYNDSKCGRDITPTKIKGNIIIKYEDILVNCNDKLTKEQTKNEPYLKLDNKSYLYSIIMIDLDAPVSKKIKKVYLHWLKVNTDTTLKDYTGPAPPKGSGNHRYFILIFKQENKINDKNISERHTFDLIDYVKKNNLTLLYFTKFIVSAEK